MIIIDLSIIVFLTKENYENTTSFLMLILKSIKTRICDFLNNKTTHLKFVNGGDINIDSDIISKPDSFISILNKIKKFMNLIKFFLFYRKTIYR